MLPGSERSDLETFSPRERQIIAAITAAQQGRDVAGALRLSPQTARSYNKDIYGRAEVQSTRPLMPQFVPGDPRADLRNQALHRTLAASDTAQLQRATLALLGAWTGVRRLWDWEIYAGGISGLPSRLASRLRSAPGTGVDQSQAAALCHAGFPERAAARCRRHSVPSQRGIDAAPIGGAEMACGAGRPSRRLVYSRCDHAGRGAGAHGRAPCGIWPAPLVRPRSWASARGCTGEVRPGGRNVVPVCPFPRPRNPRRSRMRSAANHAG